MLRRGLLAVVSGRAFIVVMRWLLLCALWIYLPTPVRGARMCPQRCSCRDAELVTECRNAQLDMVPWTLHPGLRSLSLHGNHIKEVSGSSFTSYSTLRSLDLSTNQLVSLGRRAFASLPDLEFLDLSHNMIAGLSNASLEGLSHLKQLDLAFNYIENMPAGTFQELLQLQRLDLSYNRIKQFQNADGFRGARKLRVLSLRNNELTAVPTVAFRHLTELAVLDLGLNDITELTTEAFLPLRTLEELRLDGCKLQTVQPGAFRALGSLRVLHLQDNQLVDTPSASFSDIPRLEEIHIGQNPITRLRDRAFQHLRQLQVLSLSGATELRHLEPNAFIDNQQLEQLILSQNVRLNQLDPATFRPLATLRRVNLRANGLSSLPADLLPLAWEHLEELDLRDNPLVCNCSLRWLLAKRKQQGQLLSVRSPAERRSSSSPFVVNSSQLESSSSPFINDTTKVKCVAPSHFAGMYIDEVGSEDALDCNGWSGFVRITLFTSAACLLIALVGVLLAACCVRYRDKITLFPCAGRKLSPNPSVESSKQTSGGSQWLSTSLSKKADFVLAQTAVPTDRYSGASSEPAVDVNGVYVCQLLTSSQNSSRRSASAQHQQQHYTQQQQKHQQVRPLQSLQAPDLLELCRISETDRKGFESMPRQAARVILNGTTGTLCETDIPSRRPVLREPGSTQNDNVQIPFCYYFE